MSLKLTDNAIEAVKEIVSSAAGGPASTSGMRISPRMTRDDREPSLALSVVVAPAADDQVIEDSGARVFVADAAVELLDDKTLDARFEDSNHVWFSLSEGT